MHIGVIGGGFSGTLTAIQLAKYNPKTRVSLIEARQFGFGIAYSTPFDHHLLNVPAGNMSAFDHEPNHFVSWLKTNNHSNPGYPSEPIESHFISRKLYGEYIKDTLEQAKSYSNLHLIHDEAIKLEPIHNQWQIQLKNHNALECDKVVLALGNLPPTGLPQYQSIPDEQIIINPWDYKKVDNIDAHDDVLIVGTGLTMVDVVLSLSKNKHKGKIYALSRHGLIPQAHELSVPNFKMDKVPNNLNELLRSVRQLLTDSKNTNWRGIIDSLRPFTQALWLNFSMKEKSRFLRHLRSYWDVHRHRIASNIHNHLQGLMKEDSLSIIAGRVTSIEQDKKNLKVNYRPRHQSTLKNIDVQQIIHCVGPSGDYTQLAHPLITSLKEWGWINADAMKLGLKIATNSALINHEGIQSSQLYTVGPPSKGLFWEIIAVPDIRVQIKYLCEHLQAP